MFYSRTTFLDTQTQLSAHNLATRLSFFALGFSTAAWAPLIPMAQQRLNLNHADFGVLILSMGIGSMLSMPITGVLVNKLGCRIIIAVAMIVSMMILPILSVVQSSALMAIVLFIFGTAVGGFGVSINLQAVMVEKRNAKMMMSSFHGMCSLGGLSGVLIMTALLAIGVFPLVAALVISLIILFIWIVAVPNCLSNNNQTELKPKIETSSTVIQCVERGHALKSQVTEAFSFTADSVNNSHLESKKLTTRSSERLSSQTPTSKVNTSKSSFSIILIGVMCFIAFLSEGAAMDWGGIYLVSEFGMDASLAGLAYTFFAITMTIGRFSGQRLLIFMGEQKLVVISSLTAALGLATIVVSGHWSIVLVGYALLGLGCSNIVPIMFSRVGRQNLMPKAAALSLVSSIAYSGSLSGPALVGFASEVIGLSYVFAFIAGMLACIAVLNRFSQIKSNAVI